MKNSKSSKVVRRLLVALLCLVSINASANDDTKLSKTVSKSYKVNRSTKLEVVNKYGDLILNTWDKDSIKIRIVVTAFGKNRETSEKLLDRTDFEFSMVGDYLTIHTTLDKSKGWFKDLWSELGQYSKNILSKDQLDIDYELFLPDYINVDLTNKFGDVFIPDRMGETRLELSNGSLKMDNVKKSAVLDLSFCKADIKSVEKATLYLKSVELDLLYANELTLKSSSSEIFIREASKINLTSRTDKININEVKVLQGQGSFTKIWVRSFLGTLRMNMNYGALSAENVKTGFNKIEVTGKSTDFQLDFAHNAYFKAKVIAKEGRMNLPRNHNLKQVYTDGREKFIEASGYLGTMNSTPALIDINAQGGKVDLNFAAPDASSQKD